MNTWQERNDPVIAAFRANGGKINGQEALILLTTTGAKSGQPRIIPLMHVPMATAFWRSPQKEEQSKTPTGMRMCELTQR